MRKAIIALSAALLLGGCRGSEVSGRAYVEAIGITERPAGYSVTLQIFSPEGGSEGDITKAGSEVISGEGDTLLTALSNAEVRQGRELFLGQLRVALFSPDSDIRAASESLLKNARVSPAVLTAVADNPAEILSDEKENGSAAAALEGIIKNGTLRALSPEMTAAELISDCVNERAVLLPLISGGEEIHIGGTALFKGGLYSGTLTKDEAAGICLLRGEAGAVLSSEDIAFYVERVRVRQSGNALSLSLKIRTAENPRNIDRESIEKIAAEKVLSLCTAAIESGAANVTAEKISVRVSAPDTGLIGGGG